VVVPSSLSDLRHSPSETIRRAAKGAPVTHYSGYLGTFLAYAPGVDNIRPAYVSRILPWEQMRRKHTHPRRLFKDSWRPEDKALESAEEEALERDYGDEIAQERAERHRHTPPMAGFEKPRPK
jgi:hypothetical protein